MKLKIRNKANVMYISDLVDKMIQDAPKHKKTGVTVINQNGKVYLFNYPKKK